MTVPNVTMRWCQRQATCKWCEQHIMAGEPEVVVFFWNKGEDGNRSWNGTQYYHVTNKDGVHCWEQQGLDYLKRNPYIPYIRKRKAELSPEDRRKRFLLIRQFNTMYSRRSKLTYPDGLVQELELTKRMMDIMLEVAVIGGVPKSWVEKL